MYLFALAACLGVILAIPLLHADVFINGLVLLISTVVALITLVAAGFFKLQQTAFKIILLILISLAAIHYTQSALQQRLAERLLTVQTVDVAVRVVGLSDAVDSTWRQVVRPVVPQADLPEQWLLGLPHSASPDTAAAPPNMRAGEIWQIKAKLTPVRGRASRGAFDLERWLILERGIGAQAELLGAQKIHTKSALSIVERVDRLRLQLREYFQSFTPDSRGVLLGLLTGDRALIPDQHRQLYQDAGIAHLLAISGPHVLLAAAVLTWVVGLLLNRL
ncbi:MAG: ComEC/Rec2 family competence protein, partial [Moraxellaceae bacterium]